MQIVERMSRKRCVSNELELEEGHDAWSIFIMAETAQESSDPSHLMGPLICETGNIINVW